VLDQQGITQFLAHPAVVFHDLQCASHFSSANTMPCPAKLLAVILALKECLQLAQVLELSSPTHSLHQTLPVL